MNIKKEPCSICEFYMDIIACENHECPVAIMKAENKRLQEQLDSKCDRCIARDRANAIKEFAENLKKDISAHRTEMYMNGLKGTPRTHEITYECVEEYIDDLVEQMTGGQK